tara:strand:+ start:32399 stop:33112 length:714 start_codon:yes stop_codon:yes gene_type:complete
MMRLNRYLAKAGIASRRHSESIILSGRVKLNGEKVISLATQVRPNIDTVTVDNQRMIISAVDQWYLLNKPVGFLSTLYDPFNRPTVANLITDIPDRVFPVGRLDKDTEGLLLFSTDGNLSYRITHPSFHFEKEYHVLVKGKPTDNALRRLREGITIEGRRTAKARVAIRRFSKPGAWLSIVLHEGRKRQIRKMCERVGHPVIRLVRVRLGALEDSKLPSGKWRPLTLEEICGLQPKD